MSGDHPRVLVVGTAFDMTVGGGITLSNLFEGWPKDRLALVTPDRPRVTSDVCDRTYLLGTSEIVWRWPLSLVPRTRTSLSQVADAPGEREDGGRSAAQDGSDAHSRFLSVLDLLGARHLLRRMRLSDDLRGWIREFEPDVVYAQLSELPISELVSEILDESDAALVLHFMDDWPSTVYRRGMLAPVARRRMRRLLGSLIGRSGALLAIGDAMAAEYEQRYGRPFSAVHNPVDLERWDARRTQRPYVAEPHGEPTMRLVYAGRVGRANTASLIDIAEAVAASGPGDAVLHVFTPDDGAPAVQELARHRGVVIHRPVGYDQVPGLLEWADALLLPLDFSEDGVRFARLSMPTKLSEYLAAGKPVLVYAPRGTAVAEYARGSGWALLVDQRDPAALTAGLRSLSGSERARLEMGANARRVAVERHDARVVRDRFSAELTRASEQHRRTISK